MTPAALKAEIQTGPHAATLAPFVTAKNDAAIAAFLNDKNGVGKGLVTVASMDKQRVLIALLPAALTLSTKSAALQTKWDRILRYMGDMDTIPAGAIDAMLAMAVVDTMLTQAQVDALKTRMGSRAEVLGDLIPLDTTNVACALRNDNGSPT